jgi:uncharacterized protein YndB with AHSA1/START domain
MEKVRRCAVQETRNDFAELRGDREIVISRVFDAMRAPDGTDYPNYVLYSEVVPQERLVYRHGSSAEDIANSFETVATFEEEAGKTRVTMHATFPSAEFRDTVVREHRALEGGKQTLERLGAFLEGKMVKA